jgi:hypothetical protein
MADVLSILLRYDREALEARFWAKVQKSTDGCWLWTASKFTTGYGQFACGRAMVGAHRISYWLVTSTLPEGFDICHKCDIRPCVRPDHLFLGTRAENVADCIAKGRFDTPARAVADAKFRAAGTAALMARTCCKHGHEFTPDNTYIMPNGRRSCRECRRRAGREYDRRSR